MIQSSFNTMYATVWFMVCYSHSRVSKVVNAAARCLYNRKLEVHLLSTVLNPLYLFSIPVKREIFCFILNNYFADSDFTYCTYDACNKNEELNSTKCMYCYRSHYPTVYKISNEW